MVTIGRKIRAKAAGIAGFHDRHPMPVAQLATAMPGFDDEYTWSMPAMRESETSLGREMAVVRPYLEILRGFGLTAAQVLLTIDDSEMLPENLDSIDRIANFVGRKKG